jgi:4-hydroxy-tetrahydrodipicolinate synthase
MPNDLLAELAQLEHIVGVKQANPANLAKVDGLQIYAGNDDMLADVLDLGEPGGILTAQPRVRRGDAPDGRRARAPARDRRSLQTSTATWRSRRPRAAVKAALNLLGLDVGAPRLPYVELDERRARRDPRAARAPRPAASIAQA